MKKFISSLKIKVKIVLSFLAELTKVIGTVYRELKGYINAGQKYIWILIRFMMKPFFFLKKFVISITNSFCLSFYGILLSFLLVSYFCCRRDYTFPFFTIVSDIRSNIGDIISLYGALLSVVIIGSFLYDETSHAISILVDHLDEIKQIEQKEKSLQTTLHSIWKKKSLDEEDRKILEKTPGQLGEISHKRKAFSERYASPVYKFYRQVRNFQWIVISIILICTILLFILYFDINLSFEEKYIDSLRNSFLLFTLIDHFIILHFTFRLFKQAANLKSQQNEYDDNNRSHAYNYKSDRTENFNQVDLENKLDGNQSSTSTTTWIQGDTNSGDTIAELEVKI